MDSIYFLTTFFGFFLGLLATFFFEIYRFFSERNSALEFLRIELEKIEGPLNLIVDIQERLNQNIYSKNSIPTLRYSSEASTLRYLKKDVRKLVYSISINLSHAESFRTSTINSIEKRASKSLSNTDAIMFIDHIKAARKEVIELKKIISKKSRKAFSS